MTLKYSDDEITDEELRGINLQTAAHQYMMESDAQQKATPIPFQKTPSPPRPVSPSECYIPDGQNTWLSQIAHRQPAKLPDGSPGIRLQIPYLEEFFDTTWYLIHEDTYELYAIYNDIFTEIPYFAQMQPFDLVALDTNLQEHRDSRIAELIMSGCTWDGLLKLQIPSWNGGNQPQLINPLPALCSPMSRDN